LNRNNVHSELVYVPTNVSEQKRIVAILDEAFEGIDSAIANTQKNLTNSREIFESYLNTIFTQKGDGWVEKKLGDTCIVERGSSPRPIQKFFTDSSDGVNWIKIGDTKGVNKYIYSTNQKITTEGAKQSRRVELGDFILTNSMSYGKPYIMATTGYIHDGWFVLRLAEDINKDFFYYLLASNLVQEQFKILAAGAIVKNISGDLVKRAVLPIPPISQQKAMVEVIEKLATETQRLETIYRQKLAALKELKQSILQKAFTGELTADTSKTVKEKIAA
jgi:type I restriction enzyme S subunit